MSNRKIINVAFGLMVAGICLYVLFPRFRNDWGFESSMPSNMAQSGGLTDARSRKADVCSSEQLRCKFGIHVDADGTFRVSLYFVESDFFDGCIFKGQDLDVFIYSPEGNFLRAEEAPFG
jgi:hypothetical protein